MDQQDQEYFDKHSQLFEAAKSSLEAQYLGKYVLFEDGQVVDFGDSRAEVAMRAYEAGGMRPLYRLTLRRD